MSNIFRIAWRDFVAITATKAFWIGMALSPLIGLGFSVVARSVDDAQPTRDLLIIDQTGQYESTIREAVQIANLRVLIPALRQYYYAYKSPDADSGGSTIDTQQMEFWLNNFRGDQRDSIAAAVDRAGGSAALIEAVNARVTADAPAFQAPAPRYRLLPLPPSIQRDGSVESLAGQLRPYFEGERSIETQAGNHQPFAAVAIVDNPGGELPIRGVYWATNLSNTDVSAFIQTTLDRELERQQLVAHGIEPEVMRRIQANDLDVERFDISKAVDARESGVDIVLRYIPMAFAGLLMMVVMINVGLLLQSIIEEKSNRLLEILLSSVTPLQLMLGKLLGIAAVTFLTLLSWLVIIGSFIFFTIDSEQAGQAAAAAQANIGQSGLDPEMITAATQVATAVLKLLPVFIFYLLCGYLMYASLILALGSLCTTQQEANNLTVPIILSLMVPVFIAPFLIRDPGGTLATIFTWIPLFTPMVMLARFNSDPPLLDMLGSTALLIVSVVVVMWVSVKIFRHGALHAQQPPKLWELLRVVIQREQRR